MPITESWRGVPGKYIDDPTAIDGKRFVASIHGWRMIVSLVRNIANGRCQSCGVGTTNGDSHHVYGRGAGGSKREDRANVNGTTFLIYLCRLCHERIAIKKWGSWRDDAPVEVGTFTRAKPAQESGSPIMKLGKLYL
jgi:uncharacterized protein YlaI